MNTNTNWNSTKDSFNKVAENLKKFRKKGGGNSNQSLKQWAWFGALWLGGIGAVFLLTLPFKLLIHYMSL